MFSFVWPAGKEDEKEEKTGEGEEITGESEREGGRVNVGGMRRGGRKEEGTRMKVQP